MTPTPDPLPFMEVAAVHKALWAAGFTFVPGMAERFMQEYVAQTCPCACCKDTQRGCVCRDYTSQEQCDCWSCRSAQPAPALDGADE